MKKIVALMLSAVLTFSAAPGAFASDGGLKDENVEAFITGPGTAVQDAQPGTWYYEYARWSLELGLMDLTQRSFRPYEAATRTDLMNALYEYAKFLGKDVSIGKDTDISRFKDASEIKAGKTEAWRWAWGAGLILGAEEYLNPNKEMTREYLVFVLYRFASIIDTPTEEKADIKQFKDADKISWSYKEFQWAVGAGLIKGTSDSMLSPDDAAQRAQLASVLYRFNEKYGKEYYSESAVIELYGNTSTGYMWREGDYNKNIIDVSPLMYIADKPDLIGSGGTFGFSIKGVSEGTTTLTFKYLRPWEGEASSEATVTFSVKVKPDLKISIKAIG